MNFNKVLTIYKKEMLDLLRDKRTVITSIILPIILYPIIMIGFSSIMSRQELKVKESQAFVYIEDSITDKTSLEIVSAISEIENFYLHEKSSDPDSLLSSKGIQAIITINEIVNKDGYPVYNVVVSYDKAEDKSQITYRKIKDTLNKLEKEFVTKRLKTIQISESILNAVNVEEDNVASPKKMFGFTLGKLLPYFLIMITVSSGAVVAADLVAGEKERGTLETLLVSAAHRNELVLGKYLTIITFSLATVLLNLFSMYFSMKNVLGQSGLDTSSINIPVSNFALIFIAMLPLITMFAAILLSISTYSRNMKEANTYLSPLMIVAMMMALISTFPGIDLNLGLSLIPVVNISLLFKEIMMENFNFLHFFLTIGSTLILDAVGIFLCVKLFNNESVLFRVEEEKSLKFWGKDKKNVFSHGFSLMIFMVVVLSMYYIASSWQIKDFSIGMIKTQLILILLPSLFLVKLSGEKYQDSYQLKKTNPLNFVLVALIAVPMFILVSILMFLTNLLFPIPEAYLQLWEKILNTENLGLMKSLLLIAVLPGICEEFLFRGYFMRVFRNLGQWKSILVTAVLFGILHLDMYRLFPVIILGIWMGYLFVKTGSLYIPIFAHILNNSLALLINTFVEKVSFSRFFIDGDNFRVWTYFVSIGLLSLLIVLFNRLNPSVEPMIEEVQN